MLDKADIGQLREALRDIADALLADDAEIRRLNGLLCDLRANEAEIARLRAEWDKEREFRVALEREDARLRAEVERLRAALEWYSVFENYKATMRDPAVSHGLHRASLIEQDRGDRARAALAADGKA